MKFGEVKFFNGTPVRFIERWGKYAKVRWLASGSHLVEDGTREAVYREGELAFVPISELRAD